MATQKRQTGANIVTDNNLKVVASLGIPSGTTNPVTATEGDVFYNTTTDRILAYNGSIWVACLIAADAFANPMTTVGDIIVGGASGAATRVADVATGNSLISGGVGVAPSWGKVGLTTHVSGTLPVANGGTGITSLGTGVATALGVNVGSAGAPVVNGGALGTPSSGVATNLTGTAAGLTAGTVTNGVYTTTFNTLGDARYLQLTGGEVAGFLGAYANYGVTSLPSTFYNTAFGKFGVVNNLSNGDNEVDFLSAISNVGGAAKGGFSFYKVSSAGTKTLMAEMNGTANGFTVYGRIVPSVVDASASATNLFAQYDQTTGALVSRTKAQVISDLGVVSLSADNTFTGTTNIFDNSISVGDVSEVKGQGTSGGAAFRLRDSDNSNVIDIGFNTTISGSHFINVPAANGTTAIVGTTAPASASDTGVVGEIRVTSTYIYTCIAANTWVRAAVATW